MKIYVIGSMRNPVVPEVAGILRAKGHDVFDDWYSPGPEADDKWQEYEMGRGRSFIEAINGAHAWNVFEFDKKHLDAAELIVMVAPFGKSAFAEMGYSVGRGKPVIVYVTEEPERFDIMARFATYFVDTLEKLEELVDAEAEQQPTPGALASQSEASFRRPQGAAGPRSAIFRGVRGPWV